MEMGVGMFERRGAAVKPLSNQALYRRGEEALFQAARLNFRGRRGALRRMVRRYLKSRRRDRGFLTSLISSVPRVLVLALLMLEVWATPMDAQPTFSSSSPANATHATTLSGNLTGTFSQAMSTATV